MPLNAVILKNEFETDHYLWIEACKKLNVNYQVVNLTDSDWYENIQNKSFTILLAIPGAISPLFKQLYDERLSILVKNCGYKVFPNLEEILIYENKRYLSYWLKANQIPHPATWVFYNVNEANNFISETTYPIVAKLNIGASGSGVVILKSNQQAADYVKKIFKNGISPTFGPRFNRGNIFRRIWKKIKDPVALKDKINRYKLAANNKQTGFLVLQEFIPHSYEWRVVRIGNSFFAHKKLMKGEKASGSLLKNYDNPPLSLLDFVKNITDKVQFHSQAVDIFETQTDTYLVNEMQCIFGQSDPYQMLVNGKPGRYLYADNNWFFEEGDFNTNESYDLRIKYLIEIMK